MTDTVRATDGRAMPSVTARAFAALRLATWDDIGVGLVVAAVLTAMVLL